jgi:hypothetical protein
MKRDMDIVRNLLLRSESAEHQVSIDDPLETYHVRLMIDARAFNFWNRVFCLFSARARNESGFQLVWYDISSFRSRQKADNSRRETPDN